MRRPLGALDGMLGAACLGRFTPFYRSGFMVAAAPLLAPLLPHHLYCPPPSCTIRSMTARSWLPAPRRGWSWGRARRRSRWGAGVVRCADGDTATMLRGLHSLHSLTAWPGAASAFDATSTRVAGGALQAAEERKAAFEPLCRLMKDILGDKVEKVRGHAVPAWQGGTRCSLGPCRATQQMQATVCVRVWRGPLPLLHPRHRMSDSPEPSGCVHTASSPCQHNVPPPLPLLSPLLPRWLWATASSTPPACW